MSSIIHICFSDSAGGCLKYAISTKKLSIGDKVVTFWDDISNGYIGNGVTVEERIKWLNEIFREDDTYSFEDDELQQYYASFKKHISEINDKDTVYLWYGNSGNEFCAMLYTLELLKVKNPSIYLVNVSEVIYETPIGELFSYRAVGEVDAEKLQPFIRLKRKVEPKEYEDFIKQWEALKRESSLLRIFKNDKVESVNEDYFDIDILKYTQKKFKRAARTVGMVLGLSETPISDSYIFWRIKELVKAGMIEFRGKFGVMREMEIKITENGLQLLSTNKEALTLWKGREQEYQRESELLEEGRRQGRMEERVAIARKLVGILDNEIIAEKTGLTIGQIKNLKD
ncbi:hypothetical protein J2Z44_004036 [Clostridium punense]|uniref:DUF1835 domain-containing protein n=1 Tax=Clostridium punense TaxID=1054297 RepID=A0ABS4KAG8_9CLOT|nr:MULTISPECIES: DUF1835 domain-containing protein [Clostridium]EQB87677.1 hypothetical protein M918_07865 [Clostridium sp. BL8]MBP2024181.1 hypothetical protein [Clostridium punense]